MNRKHGRVTYALKNFFSCVSRGSNDNRNAKFIVPVLGELAKAVQDRTVSWVSGEKEMSTSMMNLFASDHRNLTRIAFPFPSNEELKTLYDIAQPASFGHGQKVVLDTSYRSGRTFTTDNFAINLRPDATMLQQIKGHMLDTGCTSSEEADGHYVRAELYRVNLYGPGDFFKEHKDTPQTGIGHFGSLVFCLPSHFEGGAFVIRDTQQQELRFDWAKAFNKGVNRIEGRAQVTESKLSASSASTESTLVGVPYVAFASDLDHWVEPVVSGYRITLTFHLFREKVFMDQDEMMKPLLPRLPLALNSTNGGCVQLDTARALKQSGELRGKRVVFPLVHEYSARNGNDLVLKGGDAAIFQLLASLEVQPKVMFYYDTVDDHHREDEQEEDVEVQGEKIYMTDKVTFVSEQGLYEDSEDRIYDGLSEPIRVCWARRLPGQTLLSRKARLGNDISMDSYYGNACIITSW